MSGWAIALGLFAAPEPGLAFAGGERVRLGVASDPAATVRFLGRLFDWFDRDGDGILSKAEAARAIALPLAHVECRPPEGPVTRVEFFAYYRGAGFAPVVVQVRPAPDPICSLSEALFRRLDRDGDGKLSSKELGNAPALLRRLDEDEDERLSAAELLADGTPEAHPALDALVTIGGDARELLKVETGGTPTTITIPGGSCRVGGPGRDDVAAFRSARSFLTAQHKAIAESKPATKSLFEDDPAGGALAELFDPADRDGDGKLSPAELSAFFDLLEAGVSCRVGVAVEDRGKNLFDLIDLDADGRLDAGELRRAGAELPERFAGAGRAELPASYRITVARGYTGATFGPVSVGAAPTAKDSAAKPVPAGPGWHKAMDRNGDGKLSASEFLGPSELFRKLDRDGDGFIDVAEAGRP